MQPYNAVTALQALTFCRAIMTNILDKFKLKFTEIIIKMKQEIVSHDLTHKERNFNNYNPNPRKRKKTNDK